MTAELEQFVDPAVSREKFEAEVAEVKAREDEHRRRGWWMLEAAFPKVFVAFATSKLKPPAVICGVEVDFSNYDLEAPSVRLVDPFSREPYRQKELPTALLRRQPVNVDVVPAALAFSAVPLMQAHDPDDIPFLCIPGVREYHAHPAHTGDSWLSHRGLGAGKLYHILNTVYQYGVQPISAYGIGLQVVGFEQRQPPP